METQALSVSDLRKSYGEHQAVRGISFSIPKGEVFGLLGPNGAGKSTTISMLVGLSQPTGGKILVEGMEFQDHLDTVKGRLGFVPQDLALYPTLTARDNLTFFGQLYGLRGKTLKAKVDQVLEMVQLSDRADEPLTSYSGGMKRRVNLAAGLLHEPDILFLDEPTVGVDPQSRNAIFESVEALNRAGLTIIYTTHYMEEAERLCQRVAIMDHGQIIAMDTPANLIRSLGAGMIRLEIADGLVGQVQTQSRQLASVRSITQHDHRLDIRSRSTQETLIQVLEITNRLGAQVTSLEILEANLETVFLNLTGKSLRE
jgi:ABC-2 type transport system ATP-binding protein